MNTQDKIIQNKLGVLKLAKMLGNVSQLARSWASPETVSTAGKTPMQTFLDSKQIVEAKMLERQYEDKIENKEKNETKYGEHEGQNRIYLTPFVSVR